MRSKRIHVSQGKVDEQQALQALKDLARRLTDGDYVLIAAKPERLRTQDQNAYYHVAVIKPISEHTGYTREETHDLLQERFNYIEVIRRGVVRREPKGTSGLSVEEFNDYLFKCIRFAEEELDLIIQPSRSMTRVDLVEIEQTKKKLG